MHFCCDLCFNYCSIHRGRDKMAAICRRHFEMHFLEWHLLNFDQYWIVICSPWTNIQYPIIGSDHGLMLIRQQTIIWINDDLYIYVSIGFNELIYLCTWILNDIVLHLVLKSANSHMNICMHWSHPSKMFLKPKHHNIYLLPQLYEILQTGLFGAKFHNGWIPEKAEMGKRDFMTSDFHKDFRQTDFLPGYDLECLGALF